MIKITKKALWEALTAEPFSIKEADIRQLVITQDKGKPKFNGDDITETVTDAITALKDGYAIVSWKGIWGEILIIGYKPDELTIID